MSGVQGEQQRYGRSLDKQERDWAMFCHLAAFAGFVFPFGHVLGPLFLWLLRREESAFVDFHGRQVVNFQITMTLLYLVGLVLCFVLIGFLILPLLALWSALAAILGAIRAEEGRRWRYPLAFPFLVEVVRQRP